MTKLTTSMREQIVKAVMVHRFGEIAKALVAERAAFALRVYEDVYSEADRRKMKALPEGWLPTEDDLNIQFGDGRNYTQLTFSGSVWGEVATVLPEPLEKVWLPIINTHRNGCAKAYEPAHSFVAEYIAIKDKTEALAVEIRSARRQAESATNTASTIGRLVEAWPEIEPFTKRFVPTPKQLPAIPTVELNALFKLPVAEAA